MCYILQCRDFYFWNDPHNYLYVCWVQFSLFFPLTNTLNFLIIYPTPYVLHMFYYFKLMPEIYPQYGPCSPLDILYKDVVVTLE